MLYALYLVHVIVHTPICITNILGELLFYFQQVPTSIYLQLTLVNKRLCLRKIHLGGCKQRHILFIDNMYVSAND